MFVEFISNAKIETDCARVCGQWLLVNHLHSDKDDIPNIGEAVILPTTILLLKMRVPIARLLITSFSV